MALVTVDAYDDDETTDAVASLSIESLFFSIVLDFLLLDFDSSSSSEDLLRFPEEILN